MLNNLRQTTVKNKILEWKKTIPWWKKVIIFIVNPAIPELERMMTADEIKKRKALGLPPLPYESPAFFPSPLAFEQVALPPLVEKPVEEVPVKNLEVKENVQKDKPKKIKKSGKPGKTSKSEAYRAYQKFKYKWMGTIKVLTIICLTVWTIYGMSFLFVPLYQTFCSTSGLVLPTYKTIDTAITHHFVYYPPDKWGHGRGQVQLFPMRHLDKDGRQVFIKFLTMVDKALPVHFYAEQSFVRVKPGKFCLVFLHIANFTNEEFRVSTSYVAIPPQRAYFFKKMQCFCFDDQVIKRKSITEVPIVFFVSEDVLYGSGFVDSKLNIAVEYTLHPKTEVSKPLEVERPKMSPEERKAAIKNPRWLKFVRPRAPNESKVVHLNFPKHNN